MNTNIYNAQAYGIASKPPNPFNSIFISSLCFVISIVVFKLVICLIGGLAALGFLIYNEASRKDKFSVLGVTQFSILVAFIMIGMLVFHFTGKRMGKTTN